MTIEEAFGKTGAKEVQTDPIRAYQCWTELYQLYLRDAEKSTQVSEAIGVLESYFTSRLKIEMVEESA